MPPLACSKRPWCAVGRAGEGAALVAEQLALDQLARDRRHVDRHERARAALAVIVQRARDQLLAGAGLAVDHHREVGGGEPRDGAVDLLHRRAAADQRQRLVARRAARWARAATGGAGGASARPTTASNSCKSNGLGRYSNAPRWVAFTAVISVDCALITTTRRSGRSALDARDQVEPVLVRHDHVGDDQVALALLHPAPQRGGVAGACAPDSPERPSAWVSTVRMERSSSATRTVGGVMRGAGLIG